jgi:hypothetical protein
MPQCAIGRAITHDDADRYPGFQESCCQYPATVIAVSTGYEVLYHHVCRDHQRALQRHGLISAELPVATR